MYAGAAVAAHPVFGLLPSKRLRFCIKMLDLFSNLHTHNLVSSGVPGMLGVIINLILQNSFQLWTFIVFPFYVKFIGSLFASKNQA